MDVVEYGASRVFDAGFGLWDVRFVFHGKVKIILTCTDAPTVNRTFLIYNIYIVGSDLTHVCTHM